MKYINKVYRLFFFLVLCMPTLGLADFQELINRNPHNDPAKLEKDLAEALKNPEYSKAQGALLIGKLGTVLLVVAQEKNKDWSVRASYYGRAKASSRIAERLLELE